MIRAGDAWLCSRSFLAPPPADIWQSLRDSSRLRVFIQKRPYLRGCEKMPAKGAKGREKALRVFRAFRGPKRSSFTAS